MTFDGAISYLRDLNFISICFRLVLATLIGGIIGFERGKRGRAAGFRTHILVCLGSAMATLTGQFVFLNLTSTVDPLRLGAQVISGIGFLGVGTIIITGRNQVRGLTTAAGLWSTATIGLAVGIGFYEAALICSVLIIVAIVFLHKIDNIFFTRTSDIDIYIEIIDMQNVKLILKIIREKGYNIHNLKLSYLSNKENAVGLEGTIDAVPKKSITDIISDISEVEGIIFITETT